MPVRWRRYRARPRTKKFVHIVDLTEDAAYKQGDPPVVAVVDAGGARSMIVVPMLKEGEAIGALSIFRQAVRPFTDKQIALVTSFASQAVIAIENTRLLTELRKSLAQQTATADVLRVISSSPGELQPVFQAMLENATQALRGSFWRICCFTKPSRTACRRPARASSSATPFFQPGSELILADDPKSSAGPHACLEGGRAHHRCADRSVLHSAQCHASWPPSKTSVRGRLCAYRC